MKEKNNKNLYVYKLVRYDEPTPILPEKKVVMTEKEAHARNQGLALNLTKQRYIKLEEPVS
tara:strand:- start:2896 stop:3078 length:183 start_codon:yes stop_codon:yes gene_type:complete